MDVSDTGKQWAGNARKRLKRIEESCASLDRVRVATIEWLSPLMCAGNWIPEMISLAGGIDLLGNTGQHSHYIQWDDIVQADPDVILVMCCGFNLSRTQQEIELITSLPNFYGLRAVQNQRFYITDGNAYFNRPGPRIVDAIEMLAEIFHPESFAPRYGFAYATTYLCNNILAPK